MKSNTKTTRSHLSEALRHLPNDFALNDARYHIQAAIVQLESVEKKRGKREEIVQQQNKLVKPSINPVLSLNLLDSMIAEEKAKLDEIQRKRNADQEEEGDSFLIT